jgi:hypothetical protein
METCIANNLTLSPSDYSSPSEFTNIFHTVLAVTALPNHELCGSIHISFGFFGSVVQKAEI